MLISGKRQNRSVLLPEEPGMESLSLCKFSRSDALASSGNRHPLDEFFASVAQLEEGASQDWLSESEDLAFSICLDPVFPGFAFLRVYLGSTSDDDCDWQIKGSLLVTPTQVEIFAKDLSAI